MKNIKDITDQEAKELLKFVYPEDADGFIEVRKDIIVNSDGSVNVTMGMRPIIGVIHYSGSNNDKAVLHFDHTKSVLWLYKNGYDIGELLEENAYMTEMERDFDLFASAIESLSQPIEEYREGYKHNYNIDSIIKRAKEAVNKYWYKDY